MSAPNWDAAVCLKVNDPELWFEEGSGPGLSDGAHQAVALCWTCPVRQDCLADALRWETGQRYGIRGGLLPSERAKLGRGGTPCPQCGTPGLRERKVTSAGEASWTWSGCRGCARKAQAEGSAAIVAAHEAGESCLTIARRLELPYRSVYLAVRRNAQLRQAAP
jgi:WhiB family redox-sensing transcriptional regulator